MKKLWTAVALLGLTACVEQEGDRPSGPRVVATAAKELLGDVRNAGDLEQLGDGSSWPANFVPYQSGAFFTASVSREEGGFGVFTGNELFYTDGTDITLVHDICAGPCDSTPQMLTASSSTVYFTAFTPSLGRELWQATPLGAWLVTDFTPGSSGTDIRELTDFGGMAYFSAPVPGTSSRGLYRAQGKWTERLGTVEFPRSLVVIDGYLYFAGHSPGNGMELWRTDGTEIGTIQVADINLGSGSSNPRSIVSFNGHVWFIASDGTTGDELWYLTGTIPVRHADMIPGPESPFPMDVAPQLTVVDSTLFFVAKTDDKAARLWRVYADFFGWPLPPAAVDGACTGPICPIPTNPGQLTSAGTMLYFSAEDAAFGRHLWSAPGNYSGLASKVVRQFSGGAINSSASSDPSHFVAVGSALYMTAKDGTAPAGENQRMWLVDNRGARVVGNVPNPASPPNPYPLGFMRSTGELFFSAANDLGQEPWWLDARRAVSVEDVTAVTSNVVSMNGLAFFGGADQHGDVELWTYDGQTLNRIDINPGGSSEPQNFHVVLSPTGNWVYFGATVESAQVWRSNGTVTERVTNIGTTSGGFHLDAMISFLHPAGPKPPVEIVFTGSLGTGDYGIYSSSGALGSEVVLKAGLTGARHLTKVGARAYFMGETSALGDEVYYYDPLQTVSPTNPKMIGETVPGPAGGSITEMVEHFGNLYFVADKGPGPQIFRSGNGNPPTQVTTVSGGLWPENLKSILIGGNYQLYFRGISGFNRVFRLTGLSSTLNPVSTCQEASGFTLYKNQIYFACRGVASQYAFGLDLWRTNTSGNTAQPFLNINAQGDSDPRFLGEANGRMYLSARDDFAGREPWWFNQSGNFDSQHDINPGPPDSDPEDLVQVTHGWVLKALNKDYISRLYFADNL